MKKIMECVPNFSEGRNLEVVEAIIEPFRTTKDVVLLDYSSDADHNRSVVTVVGEPEPLKKAVVEAVKIAAEHIDLRHHKGEHRRMGATDVIPFIPISGVTMEDAIELSKEVGQIIGEEIGIPVILYEDSASAPHRQNLAKVRKGEFEGMEEKLKEPEWTPDYGEAKPHPTAGVTAVGARMPLVAYNINLATEETDVAVAIAKRVRHIGGGLRFVKGMGFELEERRQSQVSMNLTDFTRTAIYRAHEMVRMEARRYDVEIIGAEIIGLVPEAALRESLAYYLGYEEADNDMPLAQVVSLITYFLQLEGFTIDQVLEHQIAKAMENENA